MKVNTDPVISIREAVSSLSATDLLQVAVRGGIFYSFDQGSSWDLRIGDTNDGLTRQGLPELRIEIEPDQDLYLGAKDDTYHHEWIGSPHSPVQENGAYLSWFRDELTRRLAEEAPIQAEKADDRLR